MWLEEGHKKDEWIARVLLKKITRLSFKKLRLGKCKGQLGDEIATETAVRFVIGL